MKLILGVLSLIGLAASMNMHRQDEPAAPAPEAPAAEPVAEPTTAEPAEPAAEKPEEPAAEVESAESESESGP